jgi:glycosyltransferase involved in cell wall biosynthesis
MKHLIVSREYPPASYAPGGIGAYVANIARLLAERGEIVHIVSERWPGAPKERETFWDGRLIVHRVGATDLPRHADQNTAKRLLRELKGLRSSTFSSQWFAWHTAFLAERLIAEEGIDVVEGQDWEAPLYYLLLRRAIGMGPRHQPPCIVHLHSTSHIIRHFNGSQSLPRSYMLMKRMEEFCIRSADGLLCPSNYFARQCSRQYELALHSIKVIRLPVGFTPMIERSTKTWAEGSICFVGRLEPRKGIVEWMEAATRVALENPTVHFDFVGADIGGLRIALRGRLPRELKPRFRFHGSKSREDLGRYLAVAKAAVVPSRWENFPNVCIEAMSSGLPVIATSLGGMAELIEDGRSGWLAPDTGVSGMVDGLATALRRCLSAAPDERAAMGQAAAQTVRRICDNEATVSAQLTFRAHLVRHGAQRSLSLAASPMVGPSRDIGRVSALSSARGGAIVVRVEALEGAEPVLRSIDAQTTLPRAAAVVSAVQPSSARRALAQQLAERGILVLFQPQCRGTDAWNAGFKALLLKGEYGYWLFLDSHDVLAPRCLECYEATLAHRPEVGIVAPWTERTTGLESLEARPCPEQASQLVGNDVPPASAFRAEALGAEPPFRPGLPREYDIWDVANAVMVKGWLAVTIPETLATRHSDKLKVNWPQASALRAIRAEVLTRFASPDTQTALNLIEDYVPLPWSAPELKPSYRLCYHCIKTVVLHPGRTLHAIVRYTLMALKMRSLRMGARH